MLLLRAEPMTSPRERGNILERRARKQLEAEGYLVEPARPVLQWIGPGKVRSKRVDFFGAFDLFAVDPRHVRLIQVCEASGGHAAERRRKIEAIANKLPSSLSLELWVWHRPGRSKSQRGWSQERLAGGEWRPQV